jgi:hypothetical protein
VEWVATGLLLSSAGFAAWSGRHLWADGAFFFVEMVSSGSFSVPDLAREHARYLTQAPAVLLMAGGVRNAEALSFAFGLGHLLLAPAALLAFLLLVPPEARLVRCVGFGALGLTVATSVFAVSEALVLATMAVPVLAVAYLRPRQPALLGISAALHLVAVRSYQLYPVLALFVVHAAVAAFRRGGLARPVRLLWGVHLALALAGAAAAAWSVLSLQGTPNTRFAFRTLASGFRYAPVAFLALASLAALVLGARRFVAPVLWVGCAAMAVVPWVAPASNDPFLAYLARGAAAALAIATVGVACALRASGLFRLEATLAGWGRWSRAAIGPALLLSVLSWDLSSTVEWRGFSDVFRAELRRYAGCGVVPVMETDAWRERVGVQELRRYTWFWSSPYLVAALAPPGAISVVFSNPSTSVDPLFRGPPPDLTRMGKRWDFQGKACRPGPAGGTSP